MYKRQTLTNTENDRTAQEEPEQETIPLSSITYPSKGDRHGRITIAGTTVDAPVYYGCLLYTSIAATAPLWWQGRRRQTC